jgi:hypothetical protein
MAGETGSGHAALDRRLQRGRGRGCGGLVEPLAGIVHVSPGQAIIVGELGSLDLEQSQPVIYDRPIGVRLLHQDPDRGAPNTT